MVSTQEPDAHVFAGQEVTRKENGPGVGHHPQMSKGCPSRKEAQSVQIRFQGASKGTHLQRPYSISTFWLKSRSDWLFLSRVKRAGKILSRIFHMSVTLIPGISTGGSQAGPEGVVMGSEW